MNQQPMSVWKFFIGVSIIVFGMLLIAFPIIAQYVLHFGPDWLVAHKSNELPPLGFSASMMLGFVALAALTIISVVKWTDSK